MSRYTIRYRSDAAGQAVVLLVEDEHGAVHLFGGGQLQGGFKGAGATERLVRLLGRRMALSSVPEVEWYTLEGLRCLVGASSDDTADTAAIVEGAVLLTLP